jgi:hypothetical protein
MPEQISKYPEVTLKVLKGAGAFCGEGAEQKILTRCPVERFCSLPTGEICVYGISEIPQMTQITTEEIARVVCPNYQRSSLIPVTLSASELILTGLFFTMGMVVGIFSRKFKKAKP